MDSTIITAIAVVIGGCGFAALLARKRRPADLALVPKPLPPPVKPAELPVELVAGGVKADAALAQADVAVKQADGQIVETTKSLALAHDEVIAALKNLAEIEADAAKVVDDPSLFPPGKPPGH